MFLLIDDEQHYLDILSRSLHRHGYDSICANNSQEALQLLQQHPIKKIVLDLKIGHESGLLLLEQLQQQKPDCKIVMLTGYASIATAVEAVKLGALNYLCKPATSEEIIHAFDSSPNSHIDIAESPTSVDRLEWEHIQKVLSEQQGNISATARALGMHRRTLQRKLQKRPGK